MGRTLRSARPDDVTAIHALMRELAEYEKLTHLFVATPDDVRDALFGPHPAAECLVAERAAGIVGYALFFHNYSTFLGRRGLYLEDLYVQPSQRGLGLGKALLQQIAGVARERGCARFEWTVLDWNAPSIAFYQSIGAQLKNKWTICRVSGAALAKLAQKDI